MFFECQLLTSASSAYTCHNEMIVWNRQGHMGESKEPDFSFGNLLKCVKDAYLEVDEH